MKLSGDKMNRINRIRSFGLIFIIAISFFLIPLSSHLFDNNYKNPAIQSEFIHSSAENVYNNE